MEKAIEGATLDDIRAKRSQKPEVRAAAREAALRSFLHMLAFAHLSCSLILDFYDATSTFISPLSSFVLVVANVCHREIKQHKKAMLLKKQEKAGIKPAAAKPAAKKPAAKAQAPKVKAAPVKNVAKGQPKGQPKGR